jgi:small subunit ribosomal protein S16
MAVVIRLKRTGRRNRPCYRISVADSRFPRDGRTLDTLGLYDPVGLAPAQKTTLNVERARHWIGEGALPSETVNSIFKRMGVFEGMDRTKKVRKRPGRKKATKVRAKRADAQKGRSEAKEGRRNARNAVKSEAKKAAKAAAAAGDE